MGNKATLSFKMAEGREYVDVEGSFPPNGSSAVTTTYSTTGLKGRGLASVVRTSAGLFTLTFQQQYADLVNFTCSLQLASGGDQIVQMGTYTAPTGTTGAVVQIRVWDISGAAVDDIAANANNRIHWRATFRKTSVTP